MSNSVLVLFDIDGTLIQSGRAGVRGMNLAFGQLYARPQALNGVLVAGRTDRAIVAQAMGAIGVDPTDTAIAGLRDAYFENLKVELHRVVAEPSGILPGVTGLIDRLEARPDVVVGLLTGNFHGGAVIKLGHFNLWHRFRLGSFGDVHVDRRALVPVALERAREAGLDIPGPEQVVIIGDTPLDVDCAKANGSRSLAVATGLYDRATLDATGADLVLQTLEDVAAIDAWI
jgi:phosphoglycolate phosphatase-like HAD superfamily hydrolase